MEYNIERLGEKIGDFIEYEEVGYSKSYYYPILYTWKNNTSPTLNLNHLITEVDFEYYPSVTKPNVNEYILHQAGSDAYGLLTFNTETDVWMGIRTW